MHPSNRSLVLAACFLAMCCMWACNHSSGSGGAGQRLSLQPQSSESARPAHPSDAWLLGDIAVQRLGGPRTPMAPKVTGVAIVDNYGLVVYQLGQSVQELLCLKDAGTWRVLGSDGFMANGRGLVRFGLSQDLASRLIAALKPPPST